MASGKTTLAEALLGRLHLQYGNITWPLLDRLRLRGHTIAWPADVVAFVAFREESWRFSYSRHYYQQRFNFIEPHDDLSVREFLRSVGAADDNAIEAAARRLGVAPLLSLSLIKLSNGQMRRARIAKVLLARPEWLILDEPYVGLDADARHVIDVLLRELVCTGQRVLVIVKPEQTPDWVTHVLELEHGAVRRQGPRGDFFASEGVHSLPIGEEVAPLPDVNTEALIELQDVSIKYDGRTILDKVSWTVRTGERWALTGPNGSGKTTLLSLLCGDHPQAYSNNIRLFGRKRGTGESIWDIKHRIGLVSPELHLYYSEPLTAAQTASTGFHDVLAWRPITPEQNKIIRDLFDHFEIHSLAERPFMQLSTGEQRLVLLIRALVKKPPLLILDEPFHGMDDRSIARARRFLDEQLHANQALIFVSHAAEEIPQTVTRWLRLGGGCVSEIT